MKEGLQELNFISAASEFSYGSACLDPASKRQNPVVRQKSMNGPVTSVAISIWALLTVASSSFAHTVLRNATAVDVLVAAA